MIEVAPALGVPDGYRECIVVGPQDMWNGMLASHWSFRYPFQGEERPIWAQFMEAIRLVIAKETNAHLSMACNDHCSYQVDRVPIDFIEYICMDT